MLAEVSGRSGTVRRFWVTINDRTPEMLRGIRLDMFWDGADKPAVSAPIGDFFGHGLGRMATFQNALFASPEGRSFNCYIPMPFKTGMKVAVTNETQSNLAMFFFDIDCTLGDKLPENTAYFHAHFRRENPTQLQKDYEILPKVAGRGRYLGANIGVIPNTGRWSCAWWGEGEVKIYLDGDTDLPTLCGTGTGRLYRHRLGAGAVREPLSRLHAGRRQAVPVLLLPAARARSCVFSKGRRASPSSRSVTPPTTTLWT